MVSAGLFRLIANNGRQDKILTAMDSLKRRLTEIENKRRRERNEAPMPTLVDIERTHILFVKSHFKPFVDIAYEYSIVKEEATTGGKVKFNIPKYGNFLSDMAIHIVIPKFTDKYIYCDYPGVKLIDEISFTVGGNKLDKYDQDAILIHQKFYVSRDKEFGWNKCVGQNTNIREINGKTYRSGPQADASKTLELYIPLLFWFNLDPSLAFPFISDSSHIIDVEFNSINSILFIKGHGPAKIAEVPFTCELIVNNIFVSSEIYDIYMSRIGFVLVRVHKKQKHVAKNKDNILLNKMSALIETLYVGMYHDSQRADPVDWHMFGISEKTVIEDKVMDEQAFESLDEKLRHVLQKANRKTYTMRDYVSGFDTLSLVTTFPHSVDDIELYSSFTSTFYNSYIPLTYGKNICTTNDCGVLMINFNLYPGSYQPSGHLNISRVHELYIKYESSRDMNEDPGTVIIVGIALNFLLISDSSAILRYST